MIASTARFSAMAIRKRKTIVAKPAEADRHKPRVIIAIPARLADILQPLADRRMRSLSKQVVDILLEYAEKNGLVAHPSDK